MNNIRRFLLSLAVAATSIYGANAQDKDAANTTLDYMSKLTILFDADDITTARTTVEAATAQSEIDAALNSLYATADGKTFRMKNNGLYREHCYIYYNSTNANAYGGTMDNYTSVWQFKNQGDGTFKLYNSVADAYLGQPGDPTAITADGVLYEFAFTYDNKTNDLIENGENNVAFITNDASNNTYMVHQGNAGYEYKVINFAVITDEASVWTIESLPACVDEAAALIAAGNHAVDPALGQYPTAAYNTLVSAYNNMLSGTTTFTEFATAVDAYKQTRSKPVFTINGVINYASGKSIYDNNDNNSGTLYFKDTDTADPTMLWVFDIEGNTVGVADAVVVTNVGTDSLFWGSPTIRITETSDANPDDGIFLFYKTDNADPIHAQNYLSQVVTWGSYESTSGSAWTFSYVTDSYTAERYAELYFACEEYSEIVIGDAVGEYTVKSGDADALATALQAATDQLAVVTGEGGSITAFESVTQATVTSLIDALEAAKADLEINKPVAGFYRMRGANDGYSRYITCNTNSDGGRIALKDAADVETIYYYDGATLVAYNTGRYIGVSSSHWVFEAVSVPDADISQVAFSESSLHPGCFNVKSADVYLRYKQWYSDAEIDRTSTVGNNRMDDWRVESVAAVPVSISEVGWASLYTPMPLAIPAGVKAYTGVHSGSDVVLTEVAATIPANTAVLLEGAAGTYDFAVTADAAAVATNDITGSVKTMYTTDVTLPYTLQIHNNLLGMYSYIGGQLQGFKAWMSLPDASSSEGLRLLMGTTAIDAVDADVSEIVIYDLQGRRVKNPSRGIYVVNGKKMFLR